MTSGRWHVFDADFCDQDVHGQFGLSYASYLTLPRSLLQEMPADWQHRLVILLEEMTDEFRCPAEGTYEVRIRLDNGRFASDPLSAYRHPDRAAIAAARRSAA